MDQPLSLHTCGAVISWRVGLTDELRDLAKGAPRLDEFLRFAWGRLDPGVSRTRGLSRSSSGSRVIYLVAHRAQGFEHGWTSTGLA